MWNLITILHAKLEVNWLNVARVFRPTVWPSKIGRLSDMYP